MTRIATSQLNQSALADLMRAQQQSFDALQQVNSGKKAQDLKGFGADAPALLSARGLQSRTEGYLDNLKVLQNQTSAQNLALENVYDSATGLREVVTNAMSVDDADVLMQEVERVFLDAVNAINVKQGGQYLFGRVKTDTPPVNIDSLADLAAAASVDDIFDNADRARVTRLDDDRIVEAAPVADETARELFASFKRIAEFDAGPNGPFGADLTDAQRTFLTTELQNISGATDDVSAAVSKNGLLQSQVDDAFAQQTAKSDYLKGLVSDLEEVDMAEAISRLQQSQLAVEASARVFSSLSRTSLLDFLR